MSHADQWHEPWLPIQIEMDICGLSDLVSPLNQNAGILGWREEFHPFPTTKFYT